jgi:hypothetical protein
MSYLDNYKAYAAGLVKGLRVFKAYYGSRIVGAIGLYADMVAEGARNAFIARLPGHPDQAEDSALQVGFDRELVRYKYEPLADYKVRLLKAWDAYQQGGTNINLRNQINYLLTCIWAPLGVPDLTNVLNWCFFFEAGWANHNTIFNFTPGGGSVNGAWSLTPENYGAFNWGNPNTVYGASNVQADDLATLKTAIRKWLPSRTKGYILWPNPGARFYTPTPSVYTYGGGAVYTANNIAITIPVE